MGDERVINKYWLSGGGEHERKDIPVGAKVVHTDVDEVSFRFWMLCPFPAREFETRTFRIFATGEPISDEWEYKGTGVHGGYVWHLMEKAE